MDEISQSDKERLLEFIKENELDYTPIDNGIVRFHTMSCDGMKFFFYKYNEEYVVVKYDPNKDDPNNPGSIAYEYFNFKTLPQVLEQLSFYDNQIPKTYWSIIADSMEVGFDKDSYSENWYEEFITDDFYKVEDCDSYKTIVYSNSNYKPELKSPFNTLHEVSPINNESYTKVDKLYFEIHPISCQGGKESYLLKLNCNNEEVLKEYINYTVATKKGLRLLLKTLFNSLEGFKI